MKSRYIFIFSTLSLLIVMACSKSNPSVKSNNIVHNEFNPIIEISSVDSFTPVIAPDPYALPHPLDSSVVYALDVNNDSQNDFNIIVEHWYHFLSASGPSANHNYRISVNSANNNSEIAVADDHFNAKFFPLSELIGGNSTWNQSAFLYKSGGDFAVGNNSFYFSGEQFIGLRTKVNSLYYYSWLKVNKPNQGFKLQLLGYATHLTAFNGIEAGAH